MRLPKTLRIPEVEYIENIKDVKDVLRDLMTELQGQHNALWNDLRTQESLYFTKNNVRCRITLSGEDFVIQKYVGKIWTTAHTIKGA